MRCAIVVAAVSLTGLVGCNGIAGFPEPRGVERLSVSGGAVQVAGPAGFCVAPGVSRPASGFAILAPCAMLGNEQPNVLIPGIMTVQVGAAGTASVTGSEPVFASFLKTPDGAAILSANGDAGTIDVATTRIENRTVSVYFEDTGPTPIDGTQTMEWRGFLDIGDRLVTVSARGLESQPLSEVATEGLLRAMVTSLRAANAPGAAAGG